MLRGGEKTTNRRANACRNHSVVFFHYVAALFERNRT
jgi:hypothetical protein